MQSTDLRIDGRPNPDPGQEPRSEFASVTAGYFETMGIELRQGRSIDADDGVLSYSVSQRVQEIGVRVALGAGRRDVLRMIVGHGLRLAGWGIAGGIAGAAAVTWIIQSILYNVTPTDPVSFGGVALFLTLIAALASYIPARRAMAVDPIVALRND
jgi:hypothetical protein